jgi:hypothetical protein
MYKRDRATLGIPLSEIQASYAACERVWRLKREYRAELRERLAARNAEVAARFRESGLSCPVVQCSLDKLRAS